jgi:Protein of unknown function (DUF3465)
MNPIGKWLAAIALVVGAAWFVGRAPAPSAEEPVSGWEEHPSAAPAAVAPQREAPAAGGDGAEAAQAAYAQRAGGQMLRVAGKVERILADDRDGSPHQRFIIKTSLDLTLLVAHNLELAPRLAGIAVGDGVEVYGEYEWNAQGGVMHWTHDDPQGRHPAGFIDWNGSRYQ